MTKLILFTITLLILFSFVSTSLVAQTKGEAETKLDVCHVYVVDVEKARKAMDSYVETGNNAADVKTLTVGVTMFPTFSPLNGEEELTTKHFPFPNSTFFITASVFYTDESMGSTPTSKEYEILDTSMFVGITLSSKKFQSALAEGVPNASIAEITYDDFTNKVRAKQYVKVNGRSYLFGIECDCAKKRESENKTTKEK